MVRIVFVALVLGLPAWGAVTAESLKTDLVEEVQQSAALESLNELAKKAGAPSFGAVVKTIPVDDFATALGAAQGGDSAAAKQAVLKGILKSLAALGAEAAVGTGAVAAAPLIASVGAAVLVGAVFDVLVSDDQAEVTQRMRELDLRLAASKNEHDRKMLKLDRELLLGQLMLLQADATSAQLDARELLSKYARKLITREQYEQGMQALQGRYAGIVKGYDEARAQLIKLAPSNQETKLAELKERHRALKAQVDASGGQDHAAYVEMKAVYEEYMALKRSLPKR